MVLARGRGSSECHKQRSTSQRMLGIIHRANGKLERFVCRAAVETKLEVQVLLGGGIIPVILQRALADSGSHGPGTRRMTVA
jgi:hypothetical protein